MHRTSARMTAAAAALLVASTMGLGSAAWAADANPQITVGGASQEAANPALVNPDAKVQLSIHKYLGLETGKPNNGTILAQAPDATTHPPLGGINFDVYQVQKADGTPVDLKTNKGWEEASKLLGATVADVKDGATFTAGGENYKIVKVETVTTNATGLATFTKDKGVGVYFVHENLATSTNVKANSKPVDPKTLSQAKDFFVTLPMTDPAKTSSWMYDVHVYPKNQNDSIVKELVDKQSLTTENEGTAATNNKITYTIKSSITDGVDPLGMYAVYDNLDPALTLQGVSVALSDGTALDAGADYKLFASEDNAAVSKAYTTGTDVAGGPVLAVVFTDEGLKKLEIARNKPDVTVNTTVNAFGAMDADGMIPNSASFIPNKSWWEQNGKPTPNTPPNTPPENPPLTPPTPPTPPTTPPGPGEPPTPPTPPDTPGIPSNQVISKYGKVIIDKYDPAQSGVDMSGAEFAIYWDPTPGDGKCSTADVTGQKPIKTGRIDNAGKQSTDAGYNQLEFTGLQASNWYNNAEQTALLSYCLVETKAPQGYNLDATAHYLTIDYKTAQWGTDAAKGAKSAFVTEKVANEQTNLGNKLPLTGGEGVALFSVAGLALIGGGLGYYTWTQRRRKDA